MRAEHGTTARYRAGCREECCRKANARYSNMRRLKILRGEDRRIDATGTIRRIQALNRMGWTLEAIAEHAGWVSLQAVNRITSRPRVTPATAARIAAVYDRLAMVPGPSDAGRRRAERLGYAPPLAWDDIDDPNEIPAVGRDVLRHDDVDPVVVERFLAGEWRIATTKAERVEITARWTAWGRSLKALEQATGWNADRYLTRQDVAS